jgi:pimeloyl-ACP methyl ester carboxylesterase
MDVNYLGADGTLLFAQDYPGPGTPILLLPGLTLNSKSFDPLVPHLLGKRRMVAPDFRGRGRSSYADPSTYTAAVELSDTVALMDRLGIAKAAVIGTSRGGIVGLLMAAKHPQRIVGLLLNDVGLKLEPAGLLRIWSYLGRGGQFPGWAHAAAALAAVNPHHEDLSFADWEAFARRVFRDENGVPCTDYDLDLAKGFPPIADIEAGQVPEMWSILPALEHIPTSVLRGANSDLLSAETVSKMEAALPQLDATEVPGRGHVPFLDEPESLAAIDRWLARL